MPDTAWGRQEGLQPEEQEEGLPRAASAPTTAGMSREVTGSVGSSQPQRPRLRGHGPPAGTATKSKCSETSMGSICLDTKRAVRPPPGWEDKDEGSHSLPRSLAWSPCIVAGQLGRKAPGWGPRSRDNCSHRPTPRQQGPHPTGPASLAPAQVIRPLLGLGCPSALPASPELWGHSR